MKNSVHAPDSVQTPDPVQASDPLAVLDALPDPVVAVAENGTLVFANKAFARLIGAAGGARPGDPFPIAAPAFAKSSATEDPAAPGGEIECRHQTTGDPVWLAWKPFDPPGARPEPARFYLGRDITSRRAEAQSQISKRVDAEQASTAKSSFLAMMSHEIRTPMNGVLGMTQLLLDTRLTPEQRNYAEKIDRSADALLALLNDVLDYSKIESGRIELDTARFVPADLVQDVIELLAPKAHEKGIEIEAALEPDLPRAAIGDAPKLRQILINLASNAIKFTENGGVILRAGRAPGQVSAQPCLRFEVEDTGIGIGRTALATIFDEFTQADNSHAARFGGSGLGLAICKKLIEAMDGRIGVSSTPAQGSTFWIEYPFGEADLRPHGVHPGVPRVAPPKLIGLTVMIVSANPVIAEAIVAQLKQASARAIRACTASEALRLMKTRTQPAPSTIIFDLAHDEDEAAIFARQLEHVAAPGVRSLVLLSPRRKSRIDLLLRKGYSGYLLKPLRQRALIERIQYAHGLVDSQADIVTIGATMKAEQQNRPTTANPLNILVAEDNEINRALVVSLLSKAGHRVTTADNGVAVLACVADQDFDLILMDVRMPEMDGLEATRRLRSGESAGAARGPGQDKDKHKGPGGPIPIIALTANAMEEDRKQALDAGMNDFVTKPIDPAALHRLIERWTNGAAAATLTPNSDRRGTGG